MTTPDNRLIESEGLGLGYRIRWRAIYTLLFVFGPAQQNGMRDPRFRMRAERAERVQRARANRGGDSDPVSLAGP